MSQQHALASVVYRLAISAGAAVLALAAFGSSTASARYITTVKQWTDDNVWTGLQCGGVSTVGQIITIPRHIHSMHKFKFELLNDPKAALGSMVVRGVVYAWDGTKASGSALWESKPRTISLPDYAAHKVVFISGYIPVTPGQQYVVFATIDKDYGACVGGSWFDFGGPVSDVYTDGSLAYQSNAGDATRWTTSDWALGASGTINGYDLAFSVRVNF